MRPGEQDGSVIVETPQEVEDVVDALIDFSFERITPLVETKLDRSVPPIELAPDEAILAISALVLASKHPGTEPAVRARILNILSHYESTPSN